MKLNHSQKRMVGMAATGVFLLATWLCRAKPELPVAAGDALFQVRESAATADMATIVVCAPTDVGRMRMAGADGDLADDLVGMGARRPVLMQDSSAPSPPRVVRTREDDSGDNRGLFDMSDLDPFAAETKRPDSGGWGWLADDVNASTPDSFERLGAGRNSEQDRRFLDRDQDELLGTRFRMGSENGSEDGSYFRRRDRRF